MNIKIEVKKYFAFGILGIKEIFLYPINLLSRIVVHLVRIGVYILIYKYIIDISPDGTLGGLTLIEASWSVGLVQIIGQSSRYLYKEIKNDVKTGSLSIKLNKPYNYIFSLISKSFVEGILRLTVFFVVTFMFLYVIIGIPSISINIFIWILLTLVLGVLLSILIETLVGLSSFWVENPDPVYWVVNRSAWLVNGMMVPVALLPSWIKVISTYYPLSVPFLAGRAFESDLNHIFGFCILLFWVIILFVISQLIFKKAEKKLNIHGG